MLSRKEIEIAVARSGFRKALRSHQNGNCCRQGQSHHSVLVLIHRRACRRLPSPFVPAASKLLSWVFLNALLMMYSMMGYHNRGWSDYTVYRVVCRRENIVLMDSFDEVRIVCLHIAAIATAMIRSLPLLSFVYSMQVYGQCNSESRGKLMPICVFLDTAEVVGAGQGKYTLSLH